MATVKECREASDKAREENRFATASVLGTARTLVDCIRAGRTQEVTVLLKVLEDVVQQQLAAEKALIEAGVRWSQALVAGIGARRL
jgi:hypothetical protein